MAVIHALADVEDVQVRPIPPLAEADYISREDWRRTGEMIFFLFI
jgi:hypothetical protein